MKKRAFLPKEILDGDIDFNLQNGFADTLSGRVDLITTLEGQRAKENALAGYVVDHFGNPLRKETLQHCYKKLSYAVDSIDRDATPEVDLLSLLTDGYSSGEPSFFGEPWMRRARQMVFYRKLWLYPIRPHIINIAEHAKHYWDLRISGLRMSGYRRARGQEILAASLIEQAPDSPLRTEIIETYIERLVEIVLENGIETAGIETLMNVAVKWKHPLLVKKVKPRLVATFLKNT